MESGDRANLLMVVGVIVSVSLAIAGVVTVIPEFKSIPSTTSSSEPRRAALEPDRCNTETWPYLSSECTGRSRKAETVAPRIIPNK
jgi:hypothetical protein